MKKKQQIVTLKDLEPNNHRDFSFRKNDSNDSSIIKNGWWPSFSRNESQSEWFHLEWSQTTVSQSLWIFPEKSVYLSETFSHFCSLTRVPETDDLDLEAAAVGAVGAGQEAERVLHVEGGDGDVGWSREGNADCCRGEEEENQLLKPNNLKHLSSAALNSSI